MTFEDLLRNSPMEYRHVHQWDEVARYRMWTSDGTGSEPPPDAPVFVLEKCLGCWKHRERLV